MNIQLPRKDRAIALEALELFWQRVVELAPTAVSGDLSPAMTMQLEEVATVAVNQWLSNNVPVPPHIVFLPENQFRQYCPLCHFPENERGTCPSCGVDMTVCEYCKWIGYHKKDCIIWMNIEENDH